MNETHREDPHAPLSYYGARRIVWLIFFVFIIWLILRALQPVILLFALVFLLAMCLVHNHGMMASQPSYAFLTTNPPSRQPAILRGSDSPDLSQSETSRRLRRDRCTPMNTNFCAPGL